MNFYIINIDNATAEYINDIKDAASKGDIQLGDIRTVSVEDFADVLEKSSNLRRTDDQLIPSHSAPHVLAQVIIILLKRMGKTVRQADFPKMTDTPYEKDLERGIRAFSFASVRCPDACSEPTICPNTNGELAWDVGKALEDFARGNLDAEFIGFRCAHFLGSVATIPLKDIIAGWNKIKNISSITGHCRFLVVTHSKCHALAALLEVD